MEMKGIIFVVWSLCWAIQVCVKADYIYPESPGNAESIEEQNKQLVLNFSREFFIERNIDSADKYIDAGPENYIQHNPFTGDGREALKAAARQWFGEFTVDIKRVAADGDLVFIHSEFVATGPVGKSRASVDIVRVRGNKIVEHWDVSQEVPDQTVSGHSMF